MDLHGGSISVFSSGEGKGTTFTVKLPVYRMMRSTPSSRSASVNVGSQRIHQEFLIKETMNDIETVSYIVEMRSASSTKLERSVPRSECLAVGSLPLSTSVSARSSFSAVVANDENNRANFTESQDIRPSKISEEKGSDEKSYRILVVDDVRLTRKMMRRMLLPCGCTVDEASDGMQAIELVRVSISRGRPYDIILMDHQMPRMSGPEAAAAIRRLGYIGLIVGVSGLVLEEDEEVFLSHGANRVVSKPLDMAKLSNILKGELENIFYYCIINLFVLQR